MSRCRSPLQCLPSSPIRRTLTQMRCRAVAVHWRWYRSLWTTATLAVEGPTDSFVASHSHWLERSSCRFSVTLLVFSRADHNTSLVLTSNHLSCGFYLYFYWRFASKAPCIRHTSDWSTAVTSQSAVNSGARSIQIFSKYSNTLVSKRVSSCSAIRPNYQSQPPLLGFTYIGA